MTELKGIRGWRVRSLSTDPAATAVAGGTWATGGSLNTARQAFNVTNAGTQTASFGVGGYNNSVNLAIHEQYNGTAWTEAADLNTVRSNGFGGGSQSAAWAGIGMTGTAPVATNTTLTELWNGSAWTEVNDANTARRHGGAFGSTTQGLAVSGFTAPGPRTPAVEHWDGTNWTEVSELNTPRDQSAGLGTVYTAGLVAAGRTPTIVAVVEEWNGSAWTEIADVNTAREAAKGSSSSVSDGIIFGGVTATPAFVGNTEYWNGTSWTELSDLGTARGALGSGGGSSSSALAFGGYNPSVISTTEEWTAPAIFSQENEGQVYFNTTSNTLKFTKYSMPAGTWASGGSLNTARSSMTGVGTQTATLAPSGQDTSTSLTPATEEYNGTAWSEVNDIPTTLKYQGAGGIQTAGWNAAGISAWNAASFNPAIFLYDGTNWTSGPSVNTNRYYTYGGGPQTACFITTGNNTSFAAVGNTELYNGSAWTEVADTNTVRNQGWANGITTDGIVAGGSPGAKTDTELFDGTSWTEVNNLNTGRLNPGAGGGTSPGSNQIMCTGENAVPTPLGVVEFWNGTTWTEVADTAATNSSAAGANSGGSSAIIMGGFSPSPATFATITEEWTVPLANATVTTS